MKKNIIKKCCIMLLLVCILFSAQTYSYAQDATTKARVEFVAGAGPTYPVNPEDPGTDSNEGPVGGSLVIVSVSEFDFGQIPVNATSQLYDIETYRPNIQVVDLRGMGAGWRVSASLSKFSDGEQESLRGASIFINDGRPNSLSDSPAPVQAKEAELTADGANVPLITAAAGAGTGLWVMRWYPPVVAEETSDEETSGEEEEEWAEGAYIKLGVPAGVATLGGHIATINWTLENTPST